MDRQKESQDTELRELMEEGATNEQRETLRRGLARLRQVEPPAGLKEMLLRIPRDKPLTAEKPVSSPAYFSLARLAPVPVAAMLILAVIYTRYGKSPSGGESVTSGVNQRAELVLEEAFLSGNEDIFDPDVSFMEISL